MLDAFGIDSMGDQLMLFTLVLCSLMDVQTKTTIIYIFSLAFSSQIILKVLNAMSDKTEPTFDFKPLKKSNLDLFATVPQVKKMTRRDKSAFQKKSSTPTDAPSQELFHTVFSAEDVKKAAAAQDSQKGKPKHLRHSIHKDENEDKRTVFVGNISNSATRKEVKNIFKDCGSIESVRIRCQALTEMQDGKDVGRSIRVLRGDIRKDDRVTATAYVLFEDASSVDRALEKNSILVDGRHLVVTRLGVADSAYPPETSVFLGNVAYDTTEEDVWSFFATHGVPDIKRVRLIRDREKGVCKGFGYVEFNSPSSVKRAIAVRGNPLNGRELRVVHTNKSVEVKKGMTSRREQRKTDRAGDLGSHTKKKRKVEPNFHKKQEKKEYPWMGTMTNPRRKIPKDLRFLADSEKRVSHKSNK